MAKKTESASTLSGSDPATDPAVDPAIAGLSYEDAIKQLEQLVGSIERGDVGLEESLKSYHRGEQLLRHCKQLLDRAEMTVREMSLSELERPAESAQ